MSQSPQTGQFNSYEAVEEVGLFTGKGLNPLKRVNSILTIATAILVILPLFSLNPLKRVNSILTLERATEKITEQCLNPLKRVNSILT